MIVLHAVVLHAVVMLAVVTCTRSNCTALFEYIHIRCVQSCLQCIAALEYIHMCCAQPQKVLVSVGFILPVMVGLKERFPPSGQKCIKTPLVFKRGEGEEGGGGVSKAVM